MDSYYLKINFIDDIVDSYDLYNGDKLIKEIDYETSDTITDNIMKNRNIKIKKINNEYIINDINLIKKYVHIPSRKITHSNKNAGKVAILAVSTATLLALASLSYDQNSQKLNSETTYYYVNNNEYKSPNTETQINNIDYQNKEFIDTAYDEEIIYSTPTEINNVDAIYEFNYKDKTDDEDINYVMNTYGNIIDKYSITYGIDKKLIASLIAQENPYNDKNYSNIGGHGVLQIESVWNGDQISAYNFETNSMETITIDTNEANENQDYCIKVGCMIFSNYYNCLKQNFGDKLDNETLFIASLFAYNKGITQVSNSLIQNVFNLEYFLGDIKNSTGGDNNYDGHVLSFIGDQVITLKDWNGNITNYYIDNLSLDNTKKENLV